MSQKQSLHSKLGYITQSKLPNNKPQNRLILEPVREVFGVTSVLKQWHYKCT